MKKVIDKAESRGRALYDWLDSHHTFSFDTYYNPQIGRASCRERV